MPEADQPVVAVVGGGISGLAAARALACATAGPVPRVVLLEASASVGGKIAGAELAGQQVELGPDQFLRRDPSAERLCIELGLGDDLVAPAPASAAVWSRGQLRGLPRGLVLGVPTDLRALAASGIVSAAGVERAAGDETAGGPALSAAEVGLDPDGAPELERSAGQIFRGRLGDEVVDRLIDPLLGGINSGSVDTLSLGVVAPQIAGALVGHHDVVAPLAATLPAAAPARRAPSVFLGLRGGLARMVDACAADLNRRGVEMRPRWGVHSLEHLPAGGAGRRWRVVGPSGALEADAVVIAIPGYAAKPILEGLAPVAAGLLGGVAYASVAVATFAFEADRLSLPGESTWTGCLVPRVEGLTMTAATWLSEKWPWMSTPDTGFVRVSAGRFGDDRIADLDDDALADRLGDELRSVASLPSALKPKARGVTRYPASFPQYRPGHAQLIRRATGDLAAKAPGVELAGAVLGGIGIPACITSGEAAARRVLAHLVELARSG